MLVQAFTVFLALIGTTLSCLSTGARVTYAMGRDEEVPSHFGLLHGKTAVAPSRHLDAGRDLGDHRHHHRDCVSRRHDAGRAGQAQCLVQLRHLLAGDLRGAAEHACHHDLGQQLRHLPALHDHLLDRDGGLQGAPHLQRLQARGHPDLRAGGEPCHACSSTWSVRSRSRA